MRTVLFFVMLKLFAIFAQASHSRGNMRNLEESRASKVLARNSESYESNSTLCEAPPMIEAVSMDEVPLIARNVGWHEPCLKYACWYYCTWCGSYDSETGEHSNCYYSAYSQYC
jgi:hypothetical protein